MTERDQGEAEELDFWRKYLGKSGLFWPHEFRFRLNPDSPLQEAIATYVEEVEGPLVRILDVGAGPLTILGKKLPGKELEITAVDCLAGRYRELLSELEIEPVVPTLPGNAESLGSLFEPDSFDLVFSRNAIDHCADPLQALREMITVTKPGHRVMVCVFPNEGEKAKYQGLHQWNFSVEDNRWILWDSTQRIDVGDALSNVAEVEKVELDQQITTVLKKADSRTG